MRAYSCSLYKPYRQSITQYVFVYIHLSQLAMLHAESEAFSVGQRVASLGGGGLAGCGGRAVAHGPPSGHHHLAAGLVLVQRTFSSINHPVGEGKGQLAWYIYMMISHIDS